MKFLENEMIGCGIHLNPNRSDLRCGQKVFSPLSGCSEVELCSTCMLRRKLNGYQDAFYRLSKKVSDNKNRLEWVNVGIKKASEGVK